jgi:PhoPQ-activated pathogenicity-related protein
MTSLYALLVLNAGPQAKGPLQDYVARVESLPAPVVSEESPERVEVDFTSQNWQGIAWKHKIILQLPPEPIKHQTAILFITGDGPRRGDFVQLALLAKSTGMPVAMLFNIPNQPIWNMKEDDLIAHTFEKYIATGDANWPLLFPMTKAAIRAMDVLQNKAVLPKLDFKKFVITGASKRGWTTWLTAATEDPRIAGIAPMVFDNLNFAEQMIGQIKAWGKYSEQIDDYTRRGLQAKLETKAGRRLLNLVDPYTYRKRIRVPVMIVNGANDRYWTVDAHKHYWEALGPARWLLEVPNSGHGLEDINRVVASVGAFSRSVAGEFVMPRLNPVWVTEKKQFTARMEYEWKGQLFEEMVIWHAQSKSLDFSASKWEKVERLDLPGWPRVKYPRDSSNLVALRLAACPLRRSAPS